MRKNKAFDIAFVGLKNGIHHFNYKINDEFFEQFKPQDFKESDLSVHLSMDKRERFFLLDFEITGSILTACDRCADIFSLEIWDEFPFTVKQVADPEMAQEENEDPNMAFIANQDTVMNVAKWIYDFSLLSIPMQKIHPDDADGNSTCNPKALEKLENLKREQNIEDNPIWKGLEQFRNK